MSRQAYYKPHADIFAELAGEEIIVQYIKDVRQENPGMGIEKLWIMYCNATGDSSVGRDKFYQIANDYGLKLRLKRRKPRTTDSNHGFRKYPNKVKNTIPDEPNQIWVADITYIVILQPDSNGRERFAYLSLIMDSYTKEVVGHCLCETLSTEGPMEALENALKRIEGKNDIHLIHHSDRGIQYASEAYTHVLKQHGIEISMTESGDPKDNAQAERLNNTLKNELLKDKRFASIDEAREAIGKAVDFYNSRRPHRSLDMMTPCQAAGMSGEIPKRWDSQREKYIREGIQAPQGFFVSSEPAGSDETKNPMVANQI